MSRIALTAALALTLTLTGCSGGVTVGPSHTYYGPVVETTAPPAPVVGDTIDHDTAIKLRKERADDGSFAYQLPDKTWVLINTLEPLPAAVMEVEQAKADAVVPSVAFEAAAEGQKLVGAYNYSTGRTLMLIHMGTTAVGPNNVPAWILSGPLALTNGLKQNGWFTVDEAVATAQSLIATQPDAHLYDIIVANH